MTKKTRDGLYVHIPFCDRICNYCAFTKLLYTESLADRYLDMLFLELKKYSDFQFKSIYIGGGTPTSLTLSQLERLFLILKEYQMPDSLITIEINPNILMEKLDVLKDNNVKRISFGIESFSEKYLELMNRKSDYNQVKSLIEYIHALGINDINVDLIYGFKDQTIEDLKRDLDLLLSLDITHISTYCLQVEPGTILFNHHYPEADEDLANNLYQYIYQRLQTKSFYRYEVSNFSLPGFESFHNLIYWNNHEYGGVGLGASSYILKQRKTNTKSITKYLKGEYEDYIEDVTLEDEKFYFVMLGLRKENGISLKEYQLLYNEDYYYINKDKIDPLLKNESLIIKGEYLSINPKYMFIMDHILKKLLF